MKKLEQKSASAFFARALCFGAGLSLVSCNPLGELTRTDDAYCFGARLANGSCRSSSNNSKTTYTVDQTDDDNSPTGFGGGTLRGTAYSSGVLTLSTTTNNAELDESWTPHWDNLVAYWKMENNWNDSVGSNHLTATGTATFTNISKIGNYSGLYDGAGTASTSTAVTDILSGSNDFTISVWINPGTTQAQYADIFDYGHCNITNFVIQQNDNLTNQFGFGFRRNDSSWATGLTLDQIPSNIWSQLIFVKNGLTTYGYLNGKLNKTGALETTSVISKSAQRITIGGNSIGGCSSRSLNGKIDEVTIWNTPLASDEIALVFSRQSAKYSGEMKSRIIDSKSTNSNWSNLDWTTTLPFGKELPDGGGTANSESSADYTSFADAPSPYDGLMDGIVGLWHFNETNLSSGGIGKDFKDSSIQNNWATANTGVALGGPGKFEKAVSLNGTTGSLEAVSSTALISIPGTHSFWFKTKAIGPGEADGHGMPMLLQSGIHYFGIDSNTSKLEFWNGTWRVATTGSINLHEWHHAVLVYDATSTKIYLDGTEVYNDLQVINPGGTTTYFGSRPDFNRAPMNLNGAIDEVAIWNRALSANEVLQLYRRGANRIKFQVRSCTSADCSDQDAATGNGWKGPGGNYLTYFSELFNNNSVSTSCATPQACFASELTLLGDVLTGKPSMLFSNFANDGIVMNNQRYFQYRTILESDDTNTACNGGTSTCMPELKSVTIGPAHTFQQ